jgi:invasion protein IalB
MKQVLRCLTAAAILLATAIPAGAETPTASRKFGAWQLDVYSLAGRRAHGGTKSRDPAAKQVRVIQQYSWNADNKTVSLVTRVRFFDSHRAALLFILPADTDRKSKVGYQVDAGPSVTLAGLDCDSRICLATADLDPPLLEKLRQGTTLVVHYRAAGERYDQPVALTGFTKAYAALEKTEAAN